MRILGFATPASLSVTIFGEAPRWELATVFSDVRGSTPLAEQLGDKAFRDLIDRFFRTSSEVLIHSGALLGRLAGDAAIGYFVPGFAGPEYARAALDSAIEPMDAAVIAVR